MPRFISCWQTCRALAGEQVWIIHGANPYHPKCERQPSLTHPPAYMVWENVPGALSSTKGDDFHAVLEETAGCAESGLSIPRPKKVVKSGSIAGRETVGASHGEFWTLNTGESPSVAVESSLSQILEVNAPEKYSLSPERRALEF